MYSDPSSTPRSVSYVSWIPETGSKVAIAYASLDFQSQQGPSAQSALDSYIWDVENANEPDQKIIPTSPLVCLKYNPKDPHILIGGLYNGLVGTSLGLDRVID
jgi:dynein intermediate chain 2